MNSLQPLNVSDLDSGLDLQGLFLSLDLQFQGVANQTLHQDFTSQLYPTEKNHIHNSINRLTPPVYQNSQRDISNSLQSNLTSNHDNSLDMYTMPDSNEPMWTHSFCTRPSATNSLSQKEYSAISSTDPELPGTSKTQEIQFLPFVNDQTQGKRILDSNENLICQHKKKQRQRRTRVKSACVGCNQARRRCSTGRPCTRCERNKISCVSK